MTCLQYMAGQYTLTKNVHWPITIEFSEVFDKKINIALVGLKLFCDKKFTSVYLIHPLQVFFLQCKLVLASNVKIKTQYVATMLLYSSHYYSETKW